MSHEGMSWGKEAALTRLRQNIWPRKINTGVARSFGTSTGRAIAGYNSTIHLLPCLAPLGYGTAFTLPTVHKHELAFQVARQDTKQSLKTHCLSVHCESTIFMIALPAFWPPSISHTAACCLNNIFRAAYLELQTGSLPVSVLDLLSNPVMLEDLT